ncbi:MAG: DNA polymerase I [Bacilli bacterium]|nr:DNA polymerase I [Bacilli bacterium]
MKKKIVLIDGNNLMFRAYYATAYTGNLMKNSKGLVTNALYGFTNMINKIINEEKPEYMLVAFDKGKSFRHEEYKDYKAGRAKTPDELKIQMPYARDLLDKMGIKWFEIDNYEADDIVGTICRWADEDADWDALLVTSDHDYLQLISDEVTIKLLRPKDYVKYNPESFKEEYGIDPIKVIDLKALMGDSSDNIPGIPGVGEKTALKLLVDYGDLDGVYEHQDEIKGKLGEKVRENKESAYFSKKMATIYREVPIPYTFEDFKYNGPTEGLDDYFYELEFYSLIDKHKNRDEVKIDHTFKELTNVKDIDLKDPISYYIECDNENYHEANIIAMGLYDGTTAWLVPNNMIKEVFDYIKDVPKYTFDLKKNMVLLKNVSLNTIYDVNIAVYLLNKTIKDDLGVLMKHDNVDVPLFDEILKDTSDINNIVTLKARYIYDTHDKYINDLRLEDVISVFENIEMPLVKVLAKMEMNGIKCDKNILEEQSNSIKDDISKLEKEIYELAGEEFNISSPKQLGELLFEKLELKGGKKTKTGAYQTGEDILLKLKDEHPIINKILDYRRLTKLNSTYLEGLVKYIKEDGKIHTIYKQTLTRTGRLSSVDPNLQNIPTRDEQGKLIRKAFVPCNKEFLSCDYSQIELRVLAHISKDKELIKAFVDGEDIHASVAANIYGKDIKDVTKNERRSAKAVIFGIVYGISGFGLGEDLGISRKEAEAFIAKYLELYPGVKKYMDLIVEDAIKTGYTETLYKRKRYIDELSSSNYMVRESGKRMAMNTPIQGTAADILKMAMIKIYDEFEKNNIKSDILLQIHDELIFDIVDGEEDKVRDIVTSIMENIVKLEVPLKVSHDFGTDLYETK